MNDKIKKWLFVVLAFNIIGIGSELVLLEHMEDFWQWIPIVLIGLCSIAVFWDFIFSSQWSTIVLKVIMFLLIGSGVMGIWMHYSGNIEFEVEMYPTLKGPELFWESMKGGPWSVWASGRWWPARARAIPPPTWGKSSMRS